jgi:hypothetical protein
MHPSDWISIVAAIGAVGAMWYARTQARAAKAQVRYAAKQLEFAEQIQRDQAQPYVFVDLRPDERDPVLMMLMIENLGRTVARDVRVAFDPPLRSKTFSQISDLRVLREGVAALPPGRRLSWFFESSFEIFDPNLPGKYTVTVDAVGPFGPLDQLVYDIDLSALEHSEARSRAQLKDVVDQLRRVSEALDHLKPATGRLRLQRAAGSETLHASPSRILPSNENETETAR